LCMHIDQTLRDVKTKSREYRRNLDIENAFSETSKSDTESDVITSITEFIATTASTEEDISLIKSTSSRI
jgi:hypothetical protein